MTSSRTLTLVLPLLLVACSAERMSAITDRESFRHATIVGSAETPDPVLTAVRALEKRGAVEDVVVQESIPVQIRLRAPKRVIDEWKAMPQAGGLR